jgi:hypothetical protein
MPYPRRGYHRRSSRYGARPYKRRYSGRIPSASRRKLRAVANLRTGGNVGQELKFYDSEQTHNNTVSLPNSVVAMDAALPTGGVAGVYYINNPAVGSSSWQRDGRVIRNISIEVVGQVVFYMTSQLMSAVPRMPTVCVALVLDTQVNAAAAGPAGTGAAIYDAPNTLALPLRNMSNTTRYRVLAFKRIVCSVTPTQDAGSSTTEASGYQTKVFRMNRKLGFKTNFKAAAAAAPAKDDIVDNGLFLMSWADTITGISSDVHFATRLRFRG